MGQCGQPGLGLTPTRGLTPWPWQTGRGERWGCRILPAAGTDRGAHSAQEGTRTAHLAWGGRTPCPTRRDTLTPQTLQEGETSAPHPQTEGRNQSNSPSDSHTKGEAEPVSPQTDGHGIRAASSDRQTQASHQSLQTDRHRDPISLLRQTDTGILSVSSDSDPAVRPRAREAAGRIQPTRGRTHKHSPLPGQRDGGRYPPRAPEDADRQERDPARRPGPCHRASDAAPPSGGRRDPARPALPVPLQAPGNRRQTKDRRTDRRARWRRRQSARRGHGRGHGPGIPGRPPRPGAALAGCHRPRCLMI